MSDSYVHPALYPEYPPGIKLPTGTPVKTPPVPAKFKGPFQSETDPKGDIAGIYFSVKVDKYELGNWFRLDGLSVKFELAEYRAGDAWNHRWIEPSHTTYGNVKLSRMTTLFYTNQIMEWMTTTAAKRVKSMTATIVAYPLWHRQWSQQLVVKWTLRGVLPISWTGPQFDASTGKPATETLELAHEGFLPQGM